MQNMTMFMYSKPWLCRSPHSMSNFTELYNDSLLDFISFLNKTLSTVFFSSTDKFLEQVSKDLAHYSLHAKRKTIHTEDVILLMKRYSHATSSIISQL